MTLPRNTTRKVCYRCFKPQAVCVCDSVSPVANRTRIQILQHPLERHHPIGTARFAELGLRNSKLKTVYADLSGSLSTQVVCSPKTGLLFPSPDARDLETLPTDAHPDTLIVLDGTWYNAKKLYKENPWLEALPHYRLTPTQPSRYRIRQEPTLDSISTLEAIVAALNILEPETDCTALISAFDAMIDRQIAYVADGTGEPRRKRPRKRPRRSIPAQLVDSFDHTVIVYSENIRLDNYRRLPVSVCAMRMGDGATFERFIALPNQLLPRLSDLTPSGILDRYAREAVSHETLISDWAQFIQPTDTLCAWNQGTLKSLFQLSGFPRAPFLLLKAAYGNTVKQRFGTLEEVIEQLQLTASITPFAGRSATRMGNAIAIARYLHGLGIGDNACAQFQTSKI